MYHRHHELALVALERAQLLYPSKARFKSYEPHRFAAHRARGIVYFNGVRWRHEERLRPALAILPVLFNCLQRGQHVTLTYEHRSTTTLCTNVTFKTITVPLMTFKITAVVKNSVLASLAL
jgi:hypothetical protein